ncbi:DegT/DnrJ/EryC1/StrS family aminotransferase [Prochlorococcus sp. MIT 1223]|uniref:DegT/DnrJ/EryC1/StrS family aminotransferase n=1 Tax=Prochlorococcus sp. MIT 1223 TaxID=3096217 RepID=UPI002A747A52|nr:DegT/DnrJ/EryC1/StrS family aminotransferase [Prochlorococcus sp. MIT 1223]
MNNSINNLIKLNDFKREPSSLIEDQVKAVEKVLNSGWWILGKEVEDFEKSWSSICNTTHSIGVANGLDAIEIGLRSLDIGIGDEVITTPVTAFATTLAIQKTGAIPVFADIDPKTGCLDPNSVAECISRKTKAILVVHLYGRSADLNHLLDISKKENIYLVEDCAQAHLGKYESKALGSFGIFGAWSFYPTKNLGAIGDAGAVTTNDNLIMEKSKSLRNYGQTNRYTHPILGLNSRLDELQAALLNIRIKHLQEWTTRRREIAKRYWEEINNKNISLLSKPSNMLNHVNHLFIIICAEGTRNKIQFHLEENGIQTLIHYPILNNNQKAILEHRVSPKGVFNAENHCNRCLSLPIHPFLTEEEVNRVINACNSFSIN